jgi:hypothetical protein
VRVKGNIQVPTWLLTRLEDPEADEHVRSAEGDSLPRTRSAVTICPGVPDVGLL